MIDTEETSIEPIAIVSMACRYPGDIASPEDLWRIVRDEDCTTSALPEDRGWNFDELFANNVRQTGTSSTKFGHFVNDGARFDAEFFGISEREATAMHPAHRLAMMVSWEAVERAGVDPHTLRGHDVGVFVGTASPEYAMRWHKAPNDVRGRLMTGTTPSVISGRVSYFFGFTGPAITVDTACSASSVAIHVACQSLRAGECTLALAGGASYHPQPGAFTEFTKQRGLSPDGTCKAFAEDADGTAWGEGAGMVLLARLSDAVRLGYPVLAVLRGSAVNSDGASNTLTAPNGVAQEQVIRRALAQAGWHPGDVDLAEAHGTGTTLGDPIEANALLAVYGDRDPAYPLWLGSVKSNIGHTIAAAGVAGLIKVVMAIRAGVLPKTLHVNEPTSRVDWSARTVEVLREHRPWPPRGRPRRAAVSAFGFSGTNSHLLVEEAPAPHATTPDHAGETVPWVLSARTPEALREQAARLGALLDERPAPSPRDIGFSLATGRTRFDHRAVVIGAAVEDFHLGLAAITKDTDDPTVLTGLAGQNDGVVMVFPGQGSQWPRMAVELADNSDVFAAHLRRCADALAPYCDWSLLAVLRQEDGAPALDRVDVVQPALFAVMVSLAHLWQSYGVRVAAVVGHSHGEIAAACVAGALSLDAAAQIIAIRGTVMTALDDTAGMAAIALSAEDTEHALNGHTGLDIAVVNGPAATVVSGPTEELSELVAGLDERGVPAKVLPAYYASHTTQVDSIRSELLAALPALSPVAATVPFCSTVTGEVIDTRHLTTEYWYRNLRDTVRFDDAVRALLHDGHRVFVEASPHPTLVRHIRDIARVAGYDDCVAVGSLHKEDGGHGGFLRSLCQAHVRGVDIDWSSVFAGGGNRVELPTYPFQNKRLWLDDLAPAGVDATGHPWLTSAVPLADGSGGLATGLISLRTSPWLGDHEVHSRVVVPGAAIAEMMITAGRGIDSAALDSLVLSRPLVVPADGVLRIQLIIGPATADGRTARLFASTAADTPWTEHATAVLVSDDAVETDDFALPADAEPVDTAALYADLARAGVDYGPSFRRVVSAHRSGSTVYADVSLPTSLRGDHTRFALHPVLFDAALHARGGSTRLAFEWSGVRLRPSTAARLRVRVDELGEHSFRVLAVDPAGVPVLSVDSLTVATEAGELLVPRWQPITPPAKSDDDWVAIGVVPGSGLASYPSLAELRAAVLDGRATPAAVVLPVTATDDDHHAPVLAVLSVLREWLTDELFTDSRLIVLTSGAVAVRPQDRPDPALAAVWGLLRSAQSEHPGRLTLIDHDTLGDTAALLRASAEEPQLAIRAGEVLAFRLARAATVDHDRAATVADGTVLITGGTGALGGTIAKHLVSRHGVRTLVLTSRRGMNADGADQLVADLTAAGAAVEVISCDIGQRDQVAALLSTVSTRLTGIVHCAGVLANGLVESLTPHQVAAVLAAKADAARHLDELTRESALGAFVLFSSASGVFGGVGQGNYAAANAYLDALAQRRRADGLAATSLAWGLWEQRSGLEAGIDRESAGRLAPGVHLAPLTTEDALRLFDSAWCADEAVTVPVRLLADSAAPVSIRTLVRSESRDTAPDPEWPPLERIAGLTTAERETALLGLVRETVAAVTGRYAAAQVPVRRPFRELGMDSLNAVELRNRLSTSIGKHLPAAVIFDHPTATKLAAYLNGVLVKQPAPTPDTAPTDVAIDELAVDELIALSMGTAHDVEDTR